MYLYSGVIWIYAEQMNHYRSKQELSTSGKVPLSHRRLKNIRQSKSVESSDEEVLHSGDEVTTSENYKNLETFQKAQLSKKVSVNNYHNLPLEKTVFLNQSTRMLPVKMLLSLAP